MFLNMTSLKRPGIAGRSIDATLNVTNAGCFDDQEKFRHELANKDFFDPRVQHFIANMSLFL